MSTLLPSLSEAAYSKLAPRWLKDINSEHEVSRLARTAADIRELTRQQLRNQIDASRHLLSAQAEAAGQNYEVQSLISRVGEELVAVRSAVERLHADTAQQLLQLDLHVIHGFNLVVERLDELARREQQQRELLVRIVDLLSSPYEVRTVELRKKADFLFDTTLRLGNENREANLQTALELYEDIVEDRAGRLDYSVWFQIGWIHWQVTGNLASAEHAFNNSQRLSDGREDERAFRAKCLRHLARVRFQLGDFDSALLTIDRALSLDAPPSAHHDAAVYASATGDPSLTVQHLAVAIQGDVTLFSRALADSELAFPWVRDWLAEQERASKEQARVALLRASAALDRCSRVATHFGAAKFEGYYDRLERTGAIAENQSCASYATWREVEWECTSLAKCILDNADDLVKQLQCTLESENSQHATRLGRITEVARTEREQAERMHANAVADIRDRTKIKLRPPEQMKINWLLQGDGRHAWLKFLMWPFLYFFFIWVAMNIKGNLPNMWVTFGAAAVICIFFIGALDGLVKWIYGVTQFYPEANALDRQSDRLMSEERQRHLTLVNGNEAKHRAAGEELRKKIDSLRTDIERCQRWQQTLSEIRNGSPDSTFGLPPERKG